MRPGTLDDREDLDELYFPHGTSVRQEEVRRLERLEQETVTDQEDGKVPEEVWRGND